MGEPRNILFLDIDSCLNASPFGESCYDGGSQDFVEKDVPLVRSCVDSLLYVLENVENPGIVWSTSWRHCEDEVWNGWKNPRLWLERLEPVGSAVIGKTPMKMSSERHEEIGFWLYDNEYRKFFDERPWHEIGNFVVIDDVEYGMRRYGEHVLTCDHRTGLTREQADSAVKFMKSRNYNGLDWFSPDAYDETRKKSHNG